MSTFEDQPTVPFGKDGESKAARWLKSKKYSVLPACEIKANAGKGPRIFMAGTDLIAPDLLIFNGEGKAYWVEVKHKSAFTWHRITGEWVTGIDIRYYEEYCRVQEKSPWPVWLLFVQEDGVAKDTPLGMKGPTGLYAGNLRDLMQKEHHRYAGYGHGGMVYWSEKILTKWADLDEVLSYSKEGK